MPIFCNNNHVDISFFYTQSKNYYSFAAKFFCKHAKNIELQQVMTKKEISSEN